VEVTTEACRHPQVYCLFSVLVYPSIENFFLEVTKLCVRMVSTTSIYLLVLSPILTTMWRRPLVSVVRAFSTVSTTTTTTTITRTKWTAVSTGNHDGGTMGQPPKSSMATRRPTWVTQQQLRQQSFLAATDDSSSDVMTADETNETEKRTWNIAGLLKEVPRLTARCHKKIGKARQRLDKAQEEVERLLTDPNPSLEEMEQCPNIEALETDLQQLQTRLQKLNQLEVLLVELKAKGKNVTLPLHVEELVIELEVQDEPSPQQQTVKSTKKEKGPRNMEAFRLPYRRYYSKNKTEIRVSHRCCCDV
jgi:hypothetical protein